MITEVQDKHASLAKVQPCSTHMVKLCLDEGRLLSNCLLLLFLL